MSEIPQVVLIWECSFLSRVHVKVIWTSSAREGVRERAHVFAHGREKREEIHLALPLCEEGKDRACDKGRDSEAAASMNCTACSAYSLHPTEQSHSLFLPVFPFKYILYY